ncbi:MAG: GNAT family N-acetyltransferase [Gemmatimonadales bacterium]|nr:GNAT family N-acetyltransferase [Gemmatimonadales bacterium]
MGYSLARKHWGRGLTAEAARAVVDWGFRERGLAKVYAYADARNAQSLRVMEKLGMTREGTLRSHRTLRGERVDDVYYGLLRVEWETDEG